MNLVTPKVYRQPTSGGIAALDAADSVGKGVTDPYRHVPTDKPVSVSVGKWATDAKSGTSLGFDPLVGMSVRF